MFAHEEVHHQGGVRSGVQSTPGGRAVAGRIVAGWLWLGGLWLGGL